MDRAAIVSLMSELGVRNIDDKSHKEWVMGSCPLAPHVREHSGQDLRPSFGVSVHDDDKSVGHCFTCGFRGPISFLIRRLADFRGISYDSLLEDINATELFGAPAKKRISIGAGKRAASRSPAQTEMEEVPPEVEGMWEELSEHIEAWNFIDERLQSLQQWNHPHPIVYWCGGGQTDADIALSRLKYDPEEQRILFPVRGANGKLYGYTGRSIHRDHRMKVKDYFGLQKRRLLLGADEFSGENAISYASVHEHQKSLYLVEGPMDYLALRAVGIPAVACLHSGLTKEQFKELQTITDSVVLAFDHDAAGYKAAIQAWSLIGQSMKVDYLDWGHMHTKSPRNFPEGEGAKDPSELVSLAQMDTYRIVGECLRIAPTKEWTASSAGYYEAAADAGFGVLKNRVVGASGGPRKRKIGRVKLKKRV